MTVMKSTKDLTEAGQVIKVLKLEADGRVKLMDLTDPEVMNSNGKDRLLRYRVSSNPPVWHRSAWLPVIVAAAVKVAIAASFIWH